MSDPILFKRLFDALALPPGGPLLLLALAFALRSRRPRLSSALAAATLLATWLLSTGAGASWLLASLERGHPPIDAERLRALAQQQPAARRPQAIVVLGGGARRGALDQPDGETVNELTLARVAAAARAHRLTGLPVLVSGGGAEAGRPPEALLMARSLADLGVPVRWQESGSLDTADNARGTRELLAAHRVERVLLVTHAYHLPRAVAAFERAGLEVVPLSAGWFAQPLDGWKAWLPSANAARASWLALHEHAGLAWYAWRGHLSRAQPSAHASAPAPVPVPAPTPAAGIFAGEASR